MYTSFSVNVYIMSISVVRFSISNTYVAPKYKPAGAMMYVNAGNCFRPLCPTAFELWCLYFHASLEGNAKFEYLAKHIHLDLCTY